MEALYENPNFLSVCEFLPNHLYFVTVQNINNGGSCDAVIPHTEDLHFFSTDNELIYHNFYGDFGPLNITCLYKFCKKLTNKLAAYAGEPFFEKFANSRFGRKEIVDKLQEKFVRKKVVVYYTSTNNEKRANAAFLISSFALLYLGYSPRMAYKALQPNRMRYRPFQDASVGLSPYKINLKDCLDALHKASAFGFFNFYDFNVNECSYYENTEHGDMNWIVPQKFLAFPGPVEEKSDYYHHPNFYIEYFLCNNVTDVIRLNQRTYDAKCFTLFNIRHHDLHMQDGADPPDSILKHFLSISESATGAIAVHCKAGLGRTGTLIGAYLLKHYRMTPKEAIAWIRICRPGSVIRHQQVWLETHKEYLWHQGNEWRNKVYGKTEIVPFLPYGIYSFESPKKEFPGLRELLINLTKRSRFRFIAKNQSRSSKTKIHQMVKTILNSAKPARERREKEQKKDSPPPAQPTDAKLLSMKSSIDTALSALTKVESSKNLQYLKPPPSSTNDTIEYPLNPDVRRSMIREPVYKMEQQVSRPEFCNHSQEVKQPAMYSNPNSFYNQTYAESEYSQNAYSEKRYCPSVKQEVVAQQPAQIMPKTKSERMPQQYERVGKFLESKSIDKNWKQNRHGEGKTQMNQDDVCAFDTRASTTLTQYSRFSRPYLNPNYNEMEIRTDNYEPRIQTKNQTMRSMHGFLLSPDDLQSWMETFDEKCGETQEINRTNMRKSKMT